MSSPGLILAALLLSLAPASQAQTDYVRDQIRINMRTGPGNQYRILRVLVSGDEVTKLRETEDWANVRTPDGVEGWVPAGYVSDEVPPSVRLPRLEARLEQSRARVEELESELETHRAAADELEGLRSRNRELEEHNTTLTRAAMWRNMATGALIALGGLIVGILWPRDRAARTRRIKL